MLNHRNLSEILPSEKLTPGARLIAVIFFALNIPTAIIGVISWVFVFPIIITLPGLGLFVYYLKMSRDSISLPAAIGVWKMTIAYNFILLIGMISMEGFEVFPIGLGNLFAIGLAAVAWRILWEKENKESHIKINHEKAI